MQPATVPAAAPAPEITCPAGGPEQAGPEPGRQGMPPARRRNPPRPGPTVERIAGWSARHRIAATLAWFALAALALAGGHLLGTQNQPQYDPGQSGVAERMLNRLHVVTPPAESVIISARSPGRTFGNDPVLRQAAAQVVTALRARPWAAADVRSPLGPGGHSLISRNGGGALVTFTVAGPHGAADATVAADLAAVARVQARYPSLVVAEAGGASTDRAANALMGQDFRRAEFTSVPITLVLLVAVFGALIAAGIPVLLAGSAVVTAVSLLAIPSRWLPIGQGTSEVVLIIGMAVGVDYTLFYLRREREERAGGATLRQALQTAAATSGHAIVVSGLTVMISMSGLFLTGIDMYTGFAVGTITVVGVAVAGSLTVLPALLSLLGPWADRGKIPFLGHARTGARPSRLWQVLVSRVVRRPAAWGGLAVAALLALAAPALGMKTQNPPIGLPSSLPVVRTLELIQRDFPGGPSPAQVVVSGAPASSPAMRHALAMLVAGASARGPVRPPVTAVPAGHGQGLVVSVPLAGNGSDSRSTRALLALRDRVLPATFGKVRGASFAVAGDTANSYDFRTALRAAVPLVFGTVALLAFLVLMLAFRSLAIPLVSIGLNLLSVGAAYGLITLIFQGGHLEGLLGFTSFGAIMPWVPLFMFVFLFGLSMDYHVFILSRIRELRLRGATTTDAVIGGIAGSAGVVTSAAVIMVAVFSVFATLSTIDLKMVGVGLASAVFIDATVVRGICVPAALALLGDRSWYLPGWLRRKPGPAGGLPAGGPQPGQAVHHEMLRLAMSCPG